MQGVCERGQRAAREHVNSKDFSEYQRGFHDGYLAAVTGKELDLPAADMIAQLRAFESGNHGDQACLDRFSPAYRRGAAEGMERGHSRKCRRV